MAYCALYLRVPGAGVLKSFFDCGVLHLWVLGAGALMFFFVCGALYLRVPGAGALGTLSPQWWKEFLASFVGTWCLCLLGVWGWILEHGILLRLQHVATLFDFFSCSRPWDVGPEVALNKFLKVQLIHLQVYTKAWGIFQNHSKPRI